MRNRFFTAYILIFILLTVNKVSAQEEFIEPPSRHITTIPFIQLTGGVVLMQAQVGNLPDTLFTVSKIKMSIYAVKNRLCILEINFCISMTSIICN